MSVDFTPAPAPGLLVRGLRHAWWQVVRRLRTEFVVRTPQGVFTVMTADQAVGKYLYIAGQHEYDLSREVVHLMQAEGLLPRDGLQMLDIGSNIGVISIGLVRSGLVQQAVAIEPEPHNSDLLSRNVAANEVADRIVLRRHAMGDRPGVLTMELAQTNFGDHRIRVAHEPTGPDRYNEARRSTIEVPVVTLDTVAQEEGIDPARCLIWIDVQGFEGYVFAGGEVFLKHAPVTMTEVWPYGIVRSGLALEQFAETVAGFWSQYWVATRSGWSRHDMAEFPDLLGELGPDGRQANVILAGHRGS